MLRLNRSDQFFSVKGGEGMIEDTIPTTNNGRGQRALLARMQELCGTHPRWEALMAYLSDRDPLHLVNSEEVEEYKGSLSGLAAARAAGLIRSFKKRCEDDPEFQRLVDEGCDNA